VRSFELKEAQGLFRDTFEVILREEEVPILEKVLPQLPDLIPIFQPSTEEDSNNRVPTGDITPENKDEGMRTKGKEYSKWRENKEWRDTDTDKSGAVYYEELCWVITWNRVRKYLRKRVWIRNHILKILLIWEILSIKIMLGDSKSPSWKL